MRSGVRAACAVAVLACACVLLAGCGGAEDRIVGKWEADQGAAKLGAEFTKDGKATMTVLGMAVQGTYKVTGDELEWTSNGKTAKYKVKVTGSELHLTGGGVTVTYKRV